MKKLLIFLFLSASIALGQGSPSVGNPYDNGPTLPSKCSPTASQGALFFKTTAPIGLYQCTVTDTWTAVGSGGISGLTTGTIPKAASATTLADSHILDSANFTVNSSGDATANSLTLPGAGIDFTEGAAPSAPSATHWNIYAKTTTGLCEKNSAGTETCLANPTLDTVGSPVANTAWTVPNANNIVITSGTATTTVDTFTVKAGTNNTGTGVLLRVNGNTGDALSTGLQTLFQVDVPGLNGAVSVNKFGQLFTTAIVSLGSLTVSQQGGGGGLINLQSTSSTAVGILATTHHSATGGGFLFDSFNDQIATTTVPANSTPFCGRAQWFRTSDSSLQTNRWCFQTVMGTTANNPSSTFTLTNVDTGSTSGLLSMDITAASLLKLNRLLLPEGTAPTNISANASIHADSTTHELMAKTNGASTAGMLVRSQPGAIHLTGQTATKTIYTLCAAAAGACNVAGQYRVIWYFNQGGTACGTPGTGGVTFALTWKDNAGTHSAVALPMDDSSSLTATGTKFTAQTSNTAAWASGIFTVWTDGTADIQVTNTYTACSVGTLTWELATTAERLQ
jgi:hypothetical protein